ncbi:hypothetical protein N7456_006918 [Penicillium angulare]|uniref:BTB domain-containing protein n=1 Tax=Penicillium angulare TaxID=116970 RepID=A0A9W9FII9_9EURO|nr:hypothetical protein N7456_006918 [Penicillium angulare]
MYKALKNSFPRKALEPAMLESVDKEVFSRCCEYVYSGDYSVPSPTSDPSVKDDSRPKYREKQCKEKEEKEEEEEEEEEEAKRWNPSCLAWNLFYPEALSLNYDILLGHLDHPQRSESEKEIVDDPCTSYAGVLLGHAEVHRFAVRTGWLSLNALSSFRLLRLLENFTPSEKRTGDIVQLLRFVFEDSKDVGGLHNLENMLRDYVVWNVDLMMRNVDFREFLERNPSVEKTVFRWMWHTV